MNVATSLAQDRESPVLIDELSDVDVCHVACGKFHSAAVSTVGDVYVWGLESSGQMGLGSARTKVRTSRSKHAAATESNADMIGCGSRGVLD